MEFINETINVINTNHKRANYEQVTDIYIYIYFTKTIKSKQEKKKNL